MRTLPGRIADSLKGAVETIRDTETAHSESFPKEISDFIAPPPDH